MQYVALLARLNLSVAHCKIQNVWSNHSFNAGKKKALIKVFLKSFCSFNFTIHFFGCHHLSFLQISPNFLQISIHLLQNLSSSSVLLWKTCCSLKAIWFCCSASPTFFSFAFNATYCIASARKMLQVASELKAYFPLKSLFFYFV